MVWFYAWQGLDEQWNVHIVVKTKCMLLLQKSLVLSPTVKK